jgi:WD40 repeat protein
MRSHSAVFSSDGQQILTASGDYTARLWDIKGNLLAVLRGHENGVNSAVFSSDGQQILTASRDRTARLWDIKGNLLAVLRGHEGRVTSAAFSPDGRQILTGSSDDSARLWDRKGNLLTVLWGYEGASAGGIAGAESRGGIASAEFSPDGQQILTTLYKNSTPQLWDSKGNRLASFEYDWDTLISDAKFSPDGRHIWTGGDGARLWDRQGNFLAVLGDDDVSAGEGEFSPDGGQILTVNGDDTARLWDIKGNLLAVLPLHQESSSISGARWSPHAVFSPDGRQ